MANPQNETYDLVVIGSGPAGYVAAIRAAQLGMRTACVEKDAGLGGTCLNVGCIPSKALLHSSELFEQTAKHLAEHGIRVAAPELDLPAMMKRKDKIVTILTRGIAGLFKKHGVEAVSGLGSIAGPGRVDVALTAGGTRELTTERILLATGSVPIELPGLPIDGTRIVDSTGALCLPSVPGTLVVVGAGAIGLELGSVWRRLGSRVTVVELTEAITPGMDREMAKTLQKLLARQGMEFLLETRVAEARPSGAGLELRLVDKDGKAAKKSPLQADVLLVAVGRRAHTAGVGAEAAGVELDERGRIVVDDQWRTTAPGIWAVGDAIRGPMLAHKGMDEGSACVERMRGIAGSVNYDAIPAVVYTAPEFASVGLTEEQCAGQSRGVKIGRFAFAANGRAKTMGETDGSVKIIADAQTDRVLGVHIVGAHASDLIAEAAVVIEFGGSAEDIARSVHAHPTLPEAIKEAALAVDGRPIHI